MEIKDIKARLSLAAVLQHYDLQPDSHNRLHCPFHPDKTPSLQLYPDTHTFCCFSSNCNAGTGDMIRFIELKESCSKHEALVKATALARGEPVATPPVYSPAKLLIEESTINKTVLLTEIFEYYHIGLPRTKKAVAYVQSRCLDYKCTAMAYNSGGLHVESKHHHLLPDMIKAGLLKPRPAGGYQVWAKECILFPLKDAGNNIVSLYGRSITDNENSRHFYLPEREGLYPGYPQTTTRKLILTESIIDAVNLLEEPGITNNYNILALYGTNGLTPEHITAIISLENLAEIICMFDGDEAGNGAADKHYNTLKGLLPQVLFTKVVMPEGEDINSMRCTHEDGKVLLQLLEDRIPFSFSMENEKPVTIEPPVLSASHPLITTNPELLIYNDPELSIEILGGLKITGLDRMKVTLKVRHRDKAILPVWHSLDLYNHGQREQVIVHLAESFELGMSVTTHILSSLISALESYRLERIESLQPKVEARQELTAAQKQIAISELKKPNLLQRTSQLIALSGIVGESAASLIAYLVYCTRKQAIPLHVMFLGASGSGKTYLQEKISELIPEEDKIEITQITENALYYFKQHELQHKLILIEDLDGALTVFYPLRELQTKRRISKTVTLKDNKGNLKTITLTVEGPVCVSGCTTKEKIYEDNANRCLLLYIDQSKEQDRRITQYQTQAAAGAINKDREQQYQELFKNMQRMLQPIKVINPYASYIELPEQVFKPRRTMTLLLGFIEAITFYHQYQRTVQKDNNGQPYIETTTHDIAAAFKLLKDVLFSKSDELTNATRSFLEQLKVMLQETNASSFNAKAIRERLRINPGNMKRYLSELMRYGYIKGSGNRYRGSYEYSIINLQEYTSLTSSIESHLQEILVRIKAGVSSSVVQ